MRKLMLLAMAVAALAAFAIPSPASAFWKDKGVAITENKTLHFTGGLSYTGALGGISCPPSSVTMTVLLTAGTTDGHVSSFTIPQLSTCTMSGGLINCGKNSLTTFDLTGEPTATDETTQVKLTGFSIDFVLGQACVFGILSGNFTMTPDNPTEISEVTLTGTLSGLGGATTFTGAFGLAEAERKTYGL